MYLKKTPNKLGRVYLSIVDNYYDKQKKSSRQKTIESLGYLDDLENQYDNPIAHFEKRVKILNEEKKEKQAPIILELSPNERLIAGEDLTKNLGYAALSAIYHKLGIHTFLKNRQRHTSDKFNADAIMRLLVFSRFIAPASKKRTYETREKYFDIFKDSLDDIYRCLTFFHSISEKLQLWINNEIVKSYGRDTSLIYYDVTNYYFETDHVTDFKRKGVSKEHRPNPIIQMGLFIDNNGIPITYELFPGNTNDCLTFRPNFGRIKKQYNLGRVVTVADKGMTTGDNIWYTTNTPDNDGYVFSMSIRGANKEIKDYVLEQGDYIVFGDHYKRKSRLRPRTIQVTTTTGKKMKKQVDEKQIVFYSEKYAKRARADRAAALAKAQDMAQNPGNYTRVTSYGASKYIKKVEYDKETGEILTTSSILEIDEEVLREEEKFDGYYLIITSEMDEADDRIIEMYRGLWRIEESFRVTKSDLEARPVFVSREDHINAHFLTCFVTLVIGRILELILEGKYNIGRIADSLAKCNCTHLQQNYYRQTYCDEVLLDLEKSLDLDFSTKNRVLGDIKKLLGGTKKR